MSVKSALETTRTEGGSHEQVLNGIRYEEERIQKSSDELVGRKNCSDRLSKEIQDVHKDHYSHSPNPRRF